MFPSYPGCAPHVKGIVFSAQEDGSGAGIADATTEANGEFIAQCSPERILRLVAVAKAARARSAHLAKLFGGNDTRTSEHIIRAGRDTDQNIADTIAALDAG
jgi:hypothetical protein